MKTALIALLFLSAVCGASATTPLEAPLRGLYGDARQVAAVEVLDGRVVSAAGDSCGARYKGRVIESVKNSAAGETIEFGYLTQLKIGGSYLVLLGELRGAPLPGVPGFAERCESVLPPSTIMFNWRGVMEIDGDTSVLAKRDTWTVRPVSYVTYPLGTRTTKVNGEKRYRYADLVKRMTATP